MASEILILSVLSHIKYEYVQRNGGYFHCLRLYPEYYSTAIALGIHDKNAYYIDINGDWNPML